TRIRAGAADDVVLAAGSAGTNGILQILYAAFRGEGIFFTPQAPQAASMSQLLGGQGHNLIRDVANNTAIPFAAPARTPNRRQGPQRLGRAFLPVKQPAGDPVLPALALSPRPLSAEPARRSVHDQGFRPNLDEGPHTGTNSGPAGNAYPDRGHQRRISAGH